MTLAINGSSSRLCVFKHKMPEARLGIHLAPTLQQIYPFCVKWIWVSRWKFYQSFVAKRKVSNNKSIKKFRWKKNLLRRIFLLSMLFFQFSSHLYLKNQFAIVGRFSPRLFFPSWECWKSVSAQIDCLNLIAGMNLDGNR